MFSTYTELSAFFELTGLCVVAICYLTQEIPVVASSLLASVIANSVAVGLVGPFIVAYSGLGLGVNKNEEYDHLTLHKSNAIMHALPFFIGVICLICMKSYLKHSRVDLSAFILFVLACMYLLWPHVYETRRQFGFEKVRSVYSVSSGVQWCAFVGIIAFLIIGLLSSY